SDESVRWVEVVVMDIKVGESTTHIKEDKPAMSATLMPHQDKPAMSAMAAKESGCIAAICAMPSGHCPAKLRLELYYVIISSKKKTQAYAIISFKNETPVTMTTHNKINAYNRHVDRKRDNQLEREREKIGVQLNQLCASRDAYTFLMLPRVRVAFQSRACSLHTMHFLKVSENKLDVLKVQENNFESLKALKNNLEPLKLLENRPITLMQRSSQYGNVIGSFIPNRRSKIGKHFGFVRFIKTSNVDLLVNNLCTIWIGRFKLNANVVRFNRQPLNKGSHLSRGNAKVHAPSEAPVFKGSHFPVTKGGTHGLSNSYIQAFKSGSNSHNDVKRPTPTLLGLILRVFPWTRNTFAKISSKWGSLLFEEDEDALHFHRKRLCIKTTYNENNFDTFKIIIKEDKSNEGLFEKNSEVDEIYETIFEDVEPESKRSKRKKDIGLSFGNSGGILCVWDINMFHKENSTVSDYFIAIMGGLVEVSFGGYSYTWVYKSAAKMNKLDRFLISEDLMSNCPNISSIILDRYLSDHRPILLREINLDYGPIPFRFFHHWFDLDGFNSFVTEAWKSYNIQEPNAMLKFVKKLKLLKGHIRLWCMQTRSSLKFVSESSTNPISTNSKRRNQRRSKPRVEPFSIVEIPIVTMADNRTMEEMLQAPIEGYGDDIVVPDILAKNFEIMTGDVPNDAIKLMLFPYSLEGAAKIWYEKEPPRSILTWQDLITKTSIRAMQNQITNFKAEMKNEIHSSMQNQINNVKNELRSNINVLRNMMASYFQKDTASTSGSGLLPSNTIANPRGDLKVITTRSGVSYDGPPIPPPFFLSPKWWNGYLRKLHFDLSFADVLLHMPKFALMFKSLLSNKENLFDLATTPVNENCSATTRSADFVVVDYVVNPRVPLILGRPFLRVGRALIDVYGEELTLRVDDESITFKVGQTSKYSYNDAESINRIDVIDVACEEYVQEVLGFSDNSKSGNPTPNSDPIIDFSSPSLTPFEGGEFILRIYFVEIEACLTSKLISPGIDDTDFDLEGDIRILEELLNNDPSSSPFPLKELNMEEIKIVKSSIDEPLELELKELPFRLTHKTKKKLPSLVFMERLPTDIPIDPQDQEKTTFTCPYGTLAYRRMPFGLCNAPGTFQRCMMAIFYDMIEKTMEVFMDNFSILLLQEFDVIIRDKKGSENLAADHLSRLENPHQDELEKKEITETFPLNTLGMIAFRGDSSTPWFADIANYHAGNFIVKGMSS
nr:RNA-directed DNA polymerase, eukaryota [Tanacetum cinerariifolium]